MAEMGPAPEPRERRGPRILPAKLATIKLEPSISIFYKEDKNASLQLLDGRFPRDAAMIFCERIRHELSENKTKSYTVIGGDVTGLKEVLAWIKQCVSEKKLVRYRELDEATTPKILTAYANVAISATFLGIPARDLANGLTKRMMAMARRMLMSSDEVKWFYTTPRLDDEPWADSIRQVASASVFWAWWTYRLDESVTPKAMMYLDALRRRIPRLDEDLHAWCERNEAYVRRKWEEKRQNMLRERAASIVQAAANGADVSFASSAGVDGAGGKALETATAPVTPVKSSNGAAASPIATIWQNISPSVANPSIATLSTTAMAGNKARPGPGVSAAASRPGIPPHTNGHGNGNGRATANGTSHSNLTSQLAEGTSKTGKPVDWADEVNEQDEIKALQNQSKA